MAAVAQWKKDHLTGKPAAVIVGGETVVELKGKGMGGRNQELALSAARGLEGLPNAVLFSLGSDGTDGPTDAAGGIVDGETAGQLRQQGIGIDRVLEENDAYHALQKCGGLLMTGPTGTSGASASLTADQTAWNLSQAVFYHSGIQHTMAVGEGGLPCGRRQ